MHCTTWAAAPTRVRTATTRALFAALMFAVPGAACGGGDRATGPREEVLSGTYHLQALDDTRLPVQVHRGPWLDPVETRFYNLFDCQVVDGRIILEDDNAFYMEVDVEWMGDGKPGSRDIYYFGSYTVDGDVISFKFSDELEIDAHISDGSIYFLIDILGTGRIKEYRFDLQ